MISIDSPKLTSNSNKNSTITLALNASSSSLSPKSLITSSSSSSSSSPSNKTNTAIDDFKSKSKTSSSSFRIDDILEKSNENFIHSNKNELLKDESNIQEDEENNIFSQRFKKKSFNLKEENEEKTDLFYKSINQQMESNKNIPRDRDSLQSNNPLVYDFSNYFSSMNSLLSNKPNNLTSSSVLLANQHHDLNPNNHMKHDLMPFIYNSNIYSQIIFFNKFKIKIIKNLSISKRHKFKSSRCSCLSSCGCKRN
jgi:hypothetical protein